MSLFDLEGFGNKAKAQNNLEQRYNFISYKKELDTIQDDLKKFYLNFLQKFIDGSFVKVNEWRGIFNTYKHNYSDYAWNNLECPRINLQDIFNILYIMYAFILPMLKILHGWKKDNNFFTSILFEKDVEDIYELLKRNDNIIDS